MKLAVAPYLWLLLYRNMPYSFAILSTKEADNYNASFLSQLLFAQNVCMYVLHISMYECVYVCFGVCMHMHL